MTSNTGFRPSPAHFALTLTVLILGVVPLPHALSERERAPARSSRTAPTPRPARGAITRG